MRLLTITAAVFAVSAALAGPASASGAALSPGFTGVLVDGPAIDATVSFEGQVRAMKRNGVGWIRLPVYWSEVEPRKGEFDFGKLDSFIRAAAASRISIMPVVLGAPAWAAVPPVTLNAHPANVADYGSFLAVLAQRYGTKGSYWRQSGTPKVPVTRWQIWNEVDLEKYWRQDAGGGWQYSYLALLRAARSALRSADRNAIVVLAGLSNYSWRSLQKLYRAGGREAFDIAAFHPFSRTVAGVLEIVRRSRVVMRSAGDASKPLILSEIAWSSGYGFATLTYGWETTESGQAARVAEILKELAAKRKSYRLEAVAWATWLSPALGSPYSFDYSGLNRMAAGKVVAKPALTAYRNTVRKLTGH